VLLPLPIRPHEPKEESFEVSWAGMHEWLELSLVTDKKLYVIDNRLRFAGDGLSEYAAFVLCRNTARGAVERRFASYIERCDQMLQKGERSYDLRGFRAHVTAARLESRGETDVRALADKLSKEFVVSEDEAYGYPMAFWFWWDLVRRKGADVPRRFVASLDKANSFDDVIASLEEIVGEKVDLLPDVTKAKADFEAYLKAGR
jgi:hypothetical protein